MANETINWIAENQVKVGTVGGIETIIRAIRVQVALIDLCEQGCETIVSITNNNSNATDDNKTKQN